MFAPQHYFEFIVRCNRSNICYKTSGNPLKNNRLAVFLNLIIAPINSEKYLMKWILFFSFLILPLRAEEPVFSDEYVDFVRGADERGESGMWGSMSSSHHHNEEVGYYLHSSCVRQFASLGYTREQGARAFDLAMKETVDSIVLCKERFPEMEVYLNQWISSFRRQEFHCGAVSSMLASDDAVASSNGSNSTFIGAGGTLKSILNGGDREALIHEIFHSTGANNRHEHNDLNSDPWQCGSVRVRDRVYMVTELCSPLRLDGRGNAKGRFGHARDLYKTIKKCGLENGCVKIFDGSYNNQGVLESMMLYSNDMARDQAQRLCQRIESHYDCLEQAERQTPDIYRTYGRPVRAQMRRDLISRFGDNEDQIPANLLQIMGLSTSELTELSTSPCNRERFSVDNRGNLNINPSNINFGPYEDLFNPEEDEYTQTLFDEFSNVGGGATHVWLRMQKLFKSAYIGAQECPQGTPGRRLSYSLMEKLNDFESTFSSHNEEMGKMVGAMEPANSYMTRNMPFTPQPNLSGDSFFRQFYSEDTLNSIEAFHREHNYNSPNFSCREHGYELGFFLEKVLIQRDFDPTAAIESGCITWNN